MTLLGKVLIAVLAGTATAVAGTTAYFLSPPRLISLTNSSLNSFVRDKEYSKCFSLLSSKDNKNLLFACFKEELKQISTNVGNDPDYYFYNGHKWEQVTHLSKQSETNRFTVSFLDKRLGEINNKNEQLKSQKLSITLEEDCNLTNHQNLWFLSCTNEAEEEGLELTKLSLEEFKDKGD